MANDVMIQIQGDISGLQKELNSVKKELQGLSNSTSNAFSGIMGTVKKIGGIVATAFAVDKIKDFGVYALQSASDVEEMENKFNVVFKSMGTSVDKWAEDFSEAIGRTKTEIKNGVTNLGDLLTGYGMTEQAASDLSQKVIELSYDLASFNNVQDADAIDRMTKGILGEHEGLKALGISLNDTNLSAKMMEMGLEGQFSKLDEVTKAQVRWAVMLDQTKNAQGDAVRSADSYANSVKTLKSNIQEAVESFGAKLLPIATDVVQALIPVGEALLPIAETLGGALADGLQSAIDWFGTLGDKVSTVNDFFNKYKLECLTVASVLGVLTLGIGAYALAQNWALVSTALGVAMLNVWEGVCAIATTVTTSLGVAIAFLTSPIGLVVVSIIGLIGVGYLLIKNWEEIKSWGLDLWSKLCEGISSMWNSFKDWCMELWTGLCDWLKGIWESIKETASAVWDAIKTAISNVCTNIGNIVYTIWNSIKSVITTVCDTIKTVVSTIWNGIKSVITDVVTGIKSIVDTGFNWVKDKVSDIFNGLKNTVMGIWNGIGHGIQGVVNGIISVINGMVRAMNKINFSVPDWIPVLGGKSFGFNIPEVPKVSWFETGGIFTGASIIGVGENGDEAVVPLSNKSKMRPFAEAVASMMPDVTTSNTANGTGGDININVASLVVREEADIKRIAKELKTLQDRENRKRGIN